MDYLRGTARSNISPLEYGQMEPNTQLELFLYRAASEIGFARGLCCTDAYRPSEWPNDDTDISPLLDGMLAQLAQAGIEPTAKSIPDAVPAPYRVVRLGLTRGYQEALKLVADGIPGTTQERYAYYAKRAEDGRAGS